MSEETTNPYALKRPCSDCPFRKDRPFHLSRERAQEIADSFSGEMSSDFHCHKTVDYQPDGEPRIDPHKTKVCAGALITLENSGIMTFQMALGRYLGLYDSESLYSDSPVYSTLQEWLDSFPSDEDRRSA